jgi:peptidoglycan/xylan/chitin deacetylase (PgdA/CDA1 family)
MIGNVLVGVWAPFRAVLCVTSFFVLFAGVVAQTGSAADCPGHPAALGTSRTLVVDPREHPRIGTMQYPETLPLADHEVVLTFDDGPLPRYSSQILEILASQCVKATFFTIGRMARSFPEGVRKLREAGHSIGTHTQNHPPGMKRTSIERAREEIDDGIASVTAALGDGAPAPFFRIPGLSRADSVEDYMASLGIQIWSADFLADDWRHVSSSRVYDLAIKRLEDKGKGILLLHDIQPRTVAALPRILNELKVRGYRIVHVVPATPEQSATPTEPQQWQLYPPSETVATSHWPKIPNFVFADTGMLPAPSLSDMDWHEAGLMMLAEPFDRVKRLVGGIPLPREALWPRQLALAQEGAATALPVPAESVFEIREGLRAIMQAAPPARDARCAGRNKTNAAPRLHAARHRPARGSRRSRAADISP